MKRNKTKRKYHVAGIHNLKTIQSIKLDAMEDVKQGAVGECTNRALFKRGEYGHIGSNVD